MSVFSSPSSIVDGDGAVVAIVARSGAIYLADAEGFSHGTMLAPDRMELCYHHLSSAARIASCTELTKQP